MVTPRTLRTTLDMARATPQMTSPIFGSPYGMTVVVEDSLGDSSVDEGAASSYETTTGTSEVIGGDGRTL
jgi:hypothetical protein